MGLYKELIEKLRPQVESLALLVEHRAKIASEANESLNEATTELHYARAALKKLLVLTGEEKEVDY